MVEFSKEEKGAITKIKDPDCINDRLVKVSSTGYSSADLHTVIYGVNYAPWQAYEFQRALRVSEQQHFHPHRSKREEAPVYNVYRSIVRGKDGIYRKGERERERKREKERDGYKK